MNPFDLNSQFDSFIYENVSTLNKGGDKQVIRSFKTLIDSEDPNISPDNAMVFTAMKKHLASNNIVIRNLACDLLCKFYESGQRSTNLNELTATWLYKFIESPDHETGKRIFKNYLRFEDIEEYFMDTLDFENETILSLKGFLYLLKTMIGVDDTKLKEKYREWFIKKVGLFKYNSNNILVRVYGILEYLGPIEEVYSEVLNITAPSLMNNKWSILFRIYKIVPKEINRDSRYISSELLGEIINEVEYCDDFEVKTAENLYVVLKKVRNIEDYLCKNLLKVKINSLCLRGLKTSLSFLDAHFEQSLVDSIILSTLGFHPQCSLKDCYSESLNQIIDFEKVQKFDLEKSLEKTSLTACRQDKDKDESTVLKEILDSFKYLKKGQIIVRAALIGIPLRSTYFDEKEIVENISESLKVFPKETFFKKGLSFDKTEVMLKYPEEFDDESARPAIEKDFKPFVNIGRFRKVVLEVLDRFSNVELYEVRNRIFFPQDYDLFFYYRFRTGELSQIDYKELLCDYLDSSFIRDLFKHPAFDRFTFLTAVCTYLSEYKVPITTEYSAVFYDHIPEFYRNIEVRKRLLEIEELKNIYLNNLETDDEKILFLCINEILNSSDFECVVSSCSISLGRNQIFLSKVCKDLKLKKDCSIIPVKDLLRKDEKRTIDYCLRNFPFDVRDLKFVNFSYVSNEALKIVVKRLVEYFKSEDKTEGEYLRKYLTVQNNSKYFTIADAIDLMEGDDLLNKDFYEERSEIYSPFTDLLCSDMASNMINNYSLSKMESNIDQEELFEFILSGFPSKPVLFWDFLLGSISKIRNSDLVIFIEEMLRKRKDIKGEFEKLSKKSQRIFAFTFPNLFVEISNLRFNLEDLIYQEACNKIENVKCRLNKTSVDYSIKITYLSDSDEFISYVKIPFDYPGKRPTFITNVEKNSLLNLKIAELMRKTSKFMSVINLWKMNIDKKVAGAKECLFCYFILHTTDGSFPEYACIHCDNKFHNRCIERWISSYNKRTCPLCRQPIPLF